MHSDTIQYIVKDCDMVNFNDYICPTIIVVEQIVGCVDGWMFWEGFPTVVRQVIS